MDSRQHRSESSSVSCFDAASLRKAMKRRKGGRGRARAAQQRSAELPLNSEEWDYVILREAWFKEMLMGMRKVRNTRALRIRNLLYGAVLKLAGCGLDAILTSACCAYADGAGYE